MMKYYQVNWKDGRKTYVRGEDSETALSYNGINGTLQSGVAGVTECTEIPRESKQVIIHDVDGKAEYLSGNLSFVQQIRTQLLKRSDMVHISVNDVTCHYKVEETPYEFALTKVHQE